MDYTRRQLRELLTGYGKIDYFFFDGPAEQLTDYAWSLQPRHGRRRCPIGSAREIPLASRPMAADCWFIDKKTILTVAASGDGDAQPLLIDQGTVDSLTWAPDGKRLAFVSHRGSHSLIGVYDFR